MVTMTLGDTLRDAMRRAGVGTQTLSKLTGIPRTAIDNWRKGMVRRPRHWRPLLQIARVLSLSGEQTDALLASAGYPVIAVLAADLPADHPDRTHLVLWLGRPDPAPQRLQLRAPTADFVGRADALDTLIAAVERRQDAAVERRQDAAAIVGIRGMGGIGKTELAVLLADRLRHSFPDAQLMLNLHGVSAAPTSAAQALRQVIHAFTPDAKLDARSDDDIDTLQRRYCAVLSGRRAVILADDAGDAAQVRPLLPPPGCVLVVTSRQLFTLPGMTTVELGQLGEAEAVALLRAICGRIPQDSAHEMARACGYLPLALRIGGSLLHNDPAISLPDYLDALADRRQRLARLRDPDDPLLDVAASLALSHNRLDEPARSVFQQLGVLAADFTTELAEAVVNGGSVDGGGVDGGGVDGGSVDGGGVAEAVVDGGSVDGGGVAEALVNGGGVDVEATLRLLLRRSMVAYDPAGGRWRLHDLVRDLAGGYLESAGAWEATMWRYADACVRIAHEIQARYVAGGDEVLPALARFDAERPHLDAARHWAAAHEGTQRGDRLLVADTVATNKTGFLRYDLRRDMMPQTHRALAAARRIGDHHSEALILNQLGHLYINLGDVDQAIVYHRQQLALVRSAADRGGEVRALNGLAIAYTQLGQLRQAIETNEQHLALVRDMGNRRGEAMARCNLGLAHLYLGEPERALSYLEPALSAVRELGDRYGQSVILNNIGVAYLAVGDATRAAEEGERALDLVRAMGERFLEAEVLADVAPAMVAIGKVDTGIRYCGRALEIAREIQAHQVEAKALMTLGEAHLATGDLDRAREALEEALAITITVGDRHGQAECAWQLGLTLADLDPARARELLRAAVTYQQEIGHARAAEHAAALESMAAKSSL